MTFVVNEKVGVWAPQPRQIVQTLKDWVGNPEIRAEYVENCHRAARPDASRQIARSIGEVLGLPSKSKKVLEK